MIQPVLCGSGREHIGIQPLMDAVTLVSAQPARSAAGRRHQSRRRRTRKRSASPTRRSRSAAWSSRSSPTRTATCSTSASTPARSRPTAGSATPAGTSRSWSASSTTSTPIPSAAVRSCRRRPPATSWPSSACKESITGDTLCDPQHPILLEPIHVRRGGRQPVDRAGVVGRQGQAGRRARRCCKREDPTFTWRVDPDTGQTLMSGMGMLHLEIKQHRMERDFRLKVRVGKPRVSYRETLQQPIRVEGECVRQAGTSRPVRQGDAWTFEPFKGDESAGDGAQPAQARTCCRPSSSRRPSRASAARLQSGELGYPVINVRATIVGGRDGPAVLQRSRRSRRPAPMRSTRRCATTSCCWSR